jgi:hypothetical protein
MAAGLNILQTVIDALVEADDGEGGRMTIMNSMGNSVGILEGDSSLVLVTAYEEGEDAHQVNFGAEDLEVLREAISRVAVCND